MNVNLSRPQPASNSLQRGERGLDLRLSFPPSAFLSRGHGDSRSATIFSIFLASLFFSFKTRGDDWPQILGPNRDGTTRVEAFDWQRWPNLLQPAWTIELGSGFAGPAISGSSVLVAHRKGDREILMSLDRETGKARWESSWPSDYQASINPDNGPRSVPAVHGNHVVCYGADGDLVCLSLNDGKQRWLRELRKEYEAEDGYFGAGSSPLIVKDLIVVCLGGSRAGIVAVELDTGRTRWTATSYDASYASPVAFHSGGQTLLLVVTRLNTVLLNARDGVVLSEVDFGSRGPTVNAATPIAVGDREFFLTASYGVGTLRLQASGTQLKEQLRDRNLLASQYNSPVFTGQRLLGIHGREDLGVASLRAIDLTRNSVIWERQNFGTAHLLRAGDSVLALTLEGKLTLIDATTDDYSELGTTDLPSGTYRALPALVDKQLFVRSSLGPANSALMMVRLP